MVQKCPELEIAVTDNGFYIQKVIFDHPSLAIHQNLKLPIKEERAQIFWKTTNMQNLKQLQIFITKNVQYMYFLFNFMEKFYYQFE